MDNQIQKFKALTIAGFSIVSILIVVIIIMIVITSLSFACKWPFDTLLARCIAPIQSSVPLCDKNSLCLDKCPENEERKIICETCGVGTVFVDGKCVPLCPDGQIYNGFNCSNQPCKPGNIKAINKCIPDLSGLYIAYDTANRPTAMYKIATPVSPFGIYSARVRQEDKHLDFSNNFNTDPSSIKITYDNSINSTEFTDKEIKWDNGTKWVKDTDGYTLNSANI